MVDQKIAKHRQLILVSSDTEFDESMGRNIKQVNDIPPNPHNTSKYFLRLKVNLGKKFFNT